MVENHSDLCKPISVWFRTWHPISSREGIAQSRGKGIPPPPRVLRPQLPRLPASLRISLSSLNCQGLLPSPHISQGLPSSSCVSLHLSLSPHISQGLPPSPRMSPTGLPFRWVVGSTGLVGDTPYLLFQPVVVLHDGGHGHVGPFHVEHDLCGGLVLGQKETRGH